MKLIIFIGIVLFCILLGCIGPINQQDSASVNELCVNEYGQNSEGFYEVNTGKCYCNVVGDNGKILRRDIICPENI